MLHTIVGKRGRGKTSLAAELIASQKRDRIFIYDYMAEFRGFAVADHIEVEQNSSSFERFMIEAWDYCSKEIEDDPTFSALMVLDEIAVYGRNNPQIDHLYRMGRHVGLDVIAISQRFYSLPVITRSQSDIFHVFQITEQRDIQYLRGIVSEAILGTILSLKTFEYIDISL